MSVQNAIRFINTVIEDTQYRKTLYKFGSKLELINALSAKGEGFTLDEFENAINMKHVKCQTYEEADEIKQIKWWFNLFH